MTETNYLSAYRKTKHVSADSCRHLQNQVFDISSTIYNEETRQGATKYMMFPDKEKILTKAYCRILEKQLSVLTVELTNAKIEREETFLHMKRLEKECIDMKEKSNQEAVNLSEASERLLKLIGLKTQTNEYYARLNSERKRLSFDIERMAYDNGNMVSFLGSVDDKTKQTSGFFTVWFSGRSSTHESHQKMFPPPRGTSFKEMVAIFKNSLRKELSSIEVTFPWQKIGSVYDAKLDQFDFPEEVSAEKLDFGNLTSNLKQINVTARSA